ncbi:DUF6371 domain-containing protein [Macellibacteroides fermentans]|uniref:DUF6371 domain-containing protein n=1 Tax=Macellibacteroides fermentans TaxID=879969 RepID=UPI00352EDD2F
MYKSPYLQPYKGKTTRHTCPECGQKDSFTLYLDGDTHQPIHHTVGICNRAVKCGYHYPPKQYFLDNPSCSVETRHASSYNSLPLFTKQPILSQPPGEIPFSFVEKSASYNSNFIRFLCEFLTEEQMKHIGDNYALGATKNKEVIFWQIDTKGKVRTGKIMQYNPETGRRIKHESGAIDWVHNKLKKSGTLPEDFNLQQCFFGEHLLKIYPDATVCIVESEKSALISAAVLTDCIWLATGGLNNLTADKCEILRGRTVILYPDLNAYDKWSAKAQQMNALFPSPQGDGSGVRFSVSTMLEDIATPEAKAQGLDLADFLINQLKAPLSSGRGAGGEVIQPDPEPTIPPPAPARFSPELEAMIEANPAVLTLIDKLDLIEY